MWYSDNLLSMAASSIVHRLSRLLIWLTPRPLIPPAPTPSNPGSLQEDPTPSNPGSLQEDPTPSNPVVIGNDLIWEILKFLPVKSLMRFKCVSKDWLTIITDPSFTGAYPGGFRGPILVPAGVRDPYLMIHYVSIDDTGRTGSCEAHLHSTVDHGGMSLMHGSVVNGLICFYYGNTSWLYNIATRERVQLPVSGPVPSGDAQQWTPYYRLGFDPVSKLYKLLKISGIYKFHQRENKYFVTWYGEILTIGVDSSWRIIDCHSLPSDKFLTSRGYCINGVIYGMESQLTLPCFLTAFHVAEERFQSVPLPPEFDQNTLNLLRFSPGPGPALISSGTGDNTAKIDRYSYGEGGREAQGTWDNSEILTLPVDYVFPEGILPGGKVLLAGKSDSHQPCLFLYDPIKKEFEKLLVTNWNVYSKCGAPIVSEDAFYYYNQENIVSLKRLTSSCT